MLIGACSKIRSRCQFYNIGSSSDRTDCITPRRKFDRPFSVGEAMPGFEEHEICKTAQLWEILAALEAERAALLQYIVYHEAVWTARGFGGGMLPEERTRVNVLDDQIWSARLTVEQWQREVNPVRPQQQQPRKKGEMYSRRVGRNKRERNWRGDAAPVTARSQRSQV